MKNGPKTTAKIISISALVSIFGLRLLLDSRKDLAVTKPRAAEDDRSSENTSASAAMDQAGPASQSSSGAARNRAGLSHRTGPGGVAGSGKKEEAKPSAVDLTGLTTNAEKIARILQSAGEEKHFSPDDPRLEQLKAMGDPAVNDLLDAYDAVTTTHMDDKTKFVKEYLLDSALFSMLGPRDKEIILTYFREKVDFSELVWKYRFSEAGVIAFQRMEEIQRSGQNFIKIAEGRYTLPTCDAEVAAAMYPEVAIPWMLENAANPKRPWFLDYISAVAKHAPNVDLRPALRQTINASLKDENIATDLNDWARLALVRGMPEGLDASVALLRKPKFRGTQQSALEIVRNYIPFRGSAAQTADWIEKNRATLNPEPQLPYGIRAPAEADQMFPNDIVLYSPFAPESGKIGPADQRSGTVVECPYTRKKFLFP